MTHEQPNVALVAEVLAALGRGELEALLSRCHDDVALRYPGPATIPYSGLFEGRRRFEQFFHLVDSVIDVERFVIGQMAGAGDKVFVQGEARFRAKATGRSFDDRFVLVFTFRDGKVAALDEYHDTATVAAAFAGGQC